jgi:hypothetical protein
MPVGSINRANLEISDKLRANCSDTELNEIRDWVKHYAQVHDLKRRHAALTLPEVIDAAVDWFASADLDEARQSAEDALAASARLRKVLSKRGLL